MRGDLKRIEPDAMPGHLVIKAEVGAGMADLAHARFEVYPLALPCLNRSERPLLYRSSFRFLQDWITTKHERKIAA